MKQVQLRKTWAREAGVTFLLLNLNVNGGPISIIWHCANLGLVSAISSPLSTPLWLLVPDGGVAGL